MSNKKYAKRILFLAANPRDATHLRLHLEVREIEDALQQSKYRNQFILRQRGAVRQKDFQQIILDFNPRIVHFSGHGEAAQVAMAAMLPRNRKISAISEESHHSAVGKEGGIIFEDEKGDALLPVTGAALADFFKVLTNRVECVVLNSCHSETYAREIKKYIRYVIGMRQEIEDRAAIVFSRGFYTALGAGESIETAFEIGRNAILLDRLPKDQLEGLSEDQLKELSEDQLKKLPEHLKPKLDINEKIPDLPPPPPLRCKPRAVALSSLGFTGLVALARFWSPLVGPLQGIELGFYDSMIRYGSEKPDKRFLVVEVTQADARRQEESGEELLGSLSNKTLARLLEKLDEFEPRAVGLDIYREYPLDSTNEEWDRALEKRFKEQPNLFAICRAGDEGLGVPEVSPPPGIPPERVGFSNIILDKDGVLRRHLLSYDVDLLAPNEAQCNANLSFNLLLADHFLKNPEDSDSRKPIELETETIFKSGSIDDNDRDGDSDYCPGLRFTDGTLLPSLHYNTSGYQWERSIFGCQILLNYRGIEYDNEPVFETVTVGEILDNKLNIQNYKDRIILIGVTRKDGFRDYHTTPYTAISGEQMPGVVIHAHKISQILHAVSGERLLIRFLPQWGNIQWGETLWIWMWALLGGGIVWWFVASRRSVLAIVVACGSVFIVCFLTFQWYGGWLPLVPPILALLSTSSFVWWRTQLLDPDIRL
jgi:CHASE2 domain-containing sensor protein